LPDAALNEPRARKIDAGKPYNNSHRRSPSMLAGLSNVFLSAGNYFWHVGAVVGAAAADDDNDAFDWGFAGAARFAPRP
jgi:hypothetical protein